MSIEDKEDKKAAKKQQVQQSYAVDPGVGYSDTSAEMESRQGRIDGCAFYDINGNGQFDTGEPGLEGLSVELTQPPRLIKRLKTDSNGRYSFDGLAPGNYCVEFPESICIKYTDQTITYADAGPLQQTDEQSFQSSDESESDRESSRPKASSVLQAAPCRETSIKLKPSGNCGKKICLQINGGTHSVNFGYMLASSCIFGYVFRETDADEICGATETGSTALRKPLEGVPVALSSNGVPVARTSTDNEGYFQFQNVGFGTFSLKFPLEYDGKSLSLAGDALQIFVPPGVALGPNIITYDGPLATIAGQFVLPGGAGVGDVTATLVEVNPASGLAPREFSAKSGSDGRFVFNNVPKGRWTVDVPPSIPSGIPGIGFSLDESTRLKCPLKVVGSMTIPPFVFKSGILLDLLVNKFQLLPDTSNACCTPQAMQPVSTALPVAGGAGPVVFGDVINRSLKNILGASVSDDPARIIAQLTNAFQQEQRNGKTYYTWRPQGTTSLDSSQSVQISGTQVTFHQQAKDLQERINRLLGAVEPTFNDPDEEEIATLKEDIRGSLENIVAEFGRAGGALQQRVGVLIINLKRDTADLKAALGINPVATPEREMDIARREQNEANFALLEGYVNDLTNAWNSYKAAVNAFGSTAQQITTFKGTALARLLWAIEAIPSAVQEVCAAMDFVSFGPVDRRVTSIGNNSATIEQLLLWIETSASNDWPNRLVRGGARLNEVEAVKQEATAQGAALTTLRNAIGQIVLAGTGTVRASLDELGRDLTQVVKLATGIKP